MFDGCYFFIFATFCYYFDCFRQIHDVLIFSITLTMMPLFLLSIDYFSRFQAFI